MKGGLHKELEVKSEHPAHLGHLGEILETGTGSLKRDMECISLRNEKGIEIHRNKR